MSYGTPALKVTKKLMIRLQEDGDTVVLRVGFDDKEILLQARPDIFFTTDHYRSYPAVLARLSAVEKSDLSDVVDIAWRVVAPRRMVEAFDG